MDDVSLTLRSCGVLRHVVPTRGASERNTTRRNAAGDCANRLSLLITQYRYSYRYVAVDFQLLLLL